MQKPASDIPHEVALFRFSIIADLLSLPVGSGITASIAQKATQVYLIPGTRRTRIAPETIRGWLRQYRDSGFAGVVFHFVSTKFFRLFRCKAEEFCGLVHYCRKELQWRA